MNTYLIPREIGDENRFLFFTTRSLIFTGVFGGIGAVIHMLVFNPMALALEMTELKIVGIIIAVVLALIGYVLGMFKIPEIKTIAFCKNASGEYLNDIIKRVFLFHRRRKIYVYERRKA